jgi:trigger factor
VKSTVETLGPTRVRLAVEVPFDELASSLDKAYKSIARQVRVPGFRPGKAPARIIDQRVGRAVVLDEAVQDAIPRAYAEAVRDNAVRTVGQPEIELTRLDDGESLAFTAEVDIRPDVVLPDLDAISVSVDDVAVADADVDERLEALRERFGVLRGVDRPVTQGDYVSIDLHATVDGEELPGGSTTGMSYEVGGGDLMPGLDEALAGASAGEEKTFQTELVSGEHAGSSADVTVTVRSVKEKELPALDDEFAQTASEFDTLDELRADLRSRLEQVKAVEQGVQARDRLLEALLAATAVPLPESAVQSEVEWRQHDIGHQLENAGISVEDYLQMEDRSQEAFDAEIRSSSETAVKTQLVLDAIAEREQPGVSEADLTQHVMSQATRLGVSPQAYADRMAEAGNLPALVAEVRRNKALAYVLEHATVTDASGRPVDLSALRRDAEDAEVEDAEVEGAGVIEGAGVEATGAGSADTGQGEPAAADAGTETDTASDPADAGGAADSGADVPADAGSSGRPATWI